MNIPSVLKKIFETKKIEISEAYKCKYKIIAEALNSKHKVISLAKALQKDELAIIAEIKKGSPSAGIISTNFEPIKIAKAYQLGGANAISCLTDEQYFYGSPQYLRDIRPYITIPILRKDFIIDVIQVYEARAWGADSFLLIAAILDSQTLKKLYALGKELGMEALVEVHNEEELRMVLDADVPIIGINNRNLHNFSVDLDLVAKLKPLIPEDKILVGESGVKSLDDATYLRKSGANALLIGEGLMRADGLSLEKLKNNNY